MFIGDRILFQIIHEGVHCLIHVHLQVILHLATVVLLLLYMADPTNRSRELTCLCRSIRLRRIGSVITSSVGGCIGYGWRPGLASTNAYPWSRTKHILCIFVDDRGVFNRSESRRCRKIAWSTGVVILRKLCLRSGCTTVQTFINFGALHSIRETPRLIISGVLHEISTVAILSSGALSPLVISREAT